jgi:two-component system sensor histidine kinase KdpD
MTLERPDPDQLLANIQKQEAREKRGKLKIFFGMAAGVGKTYAMLESALARKAEGVDVVIGYLQAHGRSETEDKATDLETVPYKKIEYRGTLFEEPDVEAIIRRNPDLVLIDELAHTNATGSTHPKRYMDVLDLLAAGIDVYTTVNVQHLESRADTVEQITGVKVMETLPDMIMDMADEVELIDLEPDELIKRLGEGKVYATDKTGTALKNFFRKGNLTALREMALRMTAERVDVQLQDYKQEKQITTPWKSAERLMVCVSPSPLSERLIRWTRRMAYNLEAPWIAVYVEPPDDLSDSAKQTLARNLSLVHKLGGEVITTSSVDTVAALMEVARQRDITQIIMGKPLRPRWEEIRSGGSLVNRLIRNSEHIDITVITGDPEENSPRQASVLPRPSSDWKQYLLGAGIVVSTALAMFALESWQPFALTIGDYRIVALMLLFEVVILANFLGRGPILLAAGLSAILWDVLFIPPQFTIFISELQDFLMFWLYLVIAVVTSNLTTRAKKEGKVAREREKRMSALYTMANEIAEASTLDEVAKIAILQTGQVFEAEVALLIPNEDGRLNMTPHPQSTLTLSEKDTGVASAAFERDEPTGKGTDTLAVGTETLFLPLSTPGGVAGVLGIRRREDTPFSVDQRNMLDTFVNHIGLAIERELLDQRAQHAAILEESEKLYATLLDSVSHELRTPLTTIKTGTTLLVDPATSAPARLELGEDVLTATERLNRLVQNLLDMSRIQSGRLQPRIEPCDPRDLISIVLRQLGDELKTHDLIVEIEPELPLVPMDMGLMEHVLFNLLHNAADYTPPKARIRVIAKIEDEQFLLSVADRGPGLPPEFIGTAFDKFTRAPGSKLGGAGLGLSICKGFVEAHGGTITAENRPTRGGARFTVRLPLQPHEPGFR